MGNEELWRAVLTEMELSVTKANYTTWFKGTSMLSSAQGTVVVSVPNIFAKEWLENKFNKQIFTVMHKYHPEIREIKYVIGGSRPKALLARKDFAQFIPESMGRDNANDDVSSQTNLNRRYTFDSFIVGPTNELAHAACIAITKKLGQLYNPLFIYGGVGLGKTHLLEATGNFLASEPPAKKIFYISAERLTAEIVESFKNKTTEMLKQRYHGYDVLIVDDIQVISGRTSTQEIFFSIFNELYARNKQIILSSDRPPSNIPSLEERLKSRFEGGMLADIGAPEYETRLAILKAKAIEYGLSIDEESLSYIATNIQKNIRELEGALKKINAFSQIYNKVPQLKEIKQALSTYLNAPYRKPTSQSVIKSVADFYRISTSDLTKRSRRKEVVRPRQIAMYLLREEVKYSFPEIGTKLGGRDHSTVIHACMKIKEEELNSDAMRQELMMIKERIYQNFETV